MQDSVLAGRPWLDMSSAFSSHLTPNWFSVIYPQFPKVEGIVPRSSYTCRTSGSSFHILTYQRAERSLRKTTRLDGL
jgi:hypothetical protein